MIKLGLKEKGCVLFVFLSFVQVSVCAQDTSIYHPGWIDFNKNGVKDVFEDPTQPINKRISNLLGQMTVDEKTCQCATLYGYKRVLKDELPTQGWKNEIWKDGIANIDEELNGLVKTQYSFPFKPSSRAGQPGYGSNGYGRTAVFFYTLPFWIWIKLYYFCIFESDYNPEMPQE